MVESSSFVSTRSSTPNFPSTLPARSPAIFLEYPHFSSVTGHAGREPKGVFASLAKKTSSYRALWGCNNYQSNYPAEVQSEHFLSFSLPEVR